MILQLISYDILLNYIVYYTILLHLTIYIFFSIRLLYIRPFTMLICHIVLLLIFLSMFNCLVYTVYVHVLVYVLHLLTLLLLTPLSLWPCNFAFSRYTGYILILGYLFLIIFLLPLFIFPTSPSVDQSYQI